MWKYRIKGESCNSEPALQHSQAGEKTGLKVSLSQKSSQLALKMNKIQKNFFSAAPSLQSGKNTKPTDSGKHSNPEVLYGGLQSELPNSQI